MTCHTRISSLNSQESQPAAVHIKADPGDVGAGVIEHITCAVAASPRRRRRAPSLSRRGPGASRM
jgi:hypothetical protein